MGSVTDFINSIYIASSQKEEWKEENMKRGLKVFAVAALIWIQLENAGAVEFESMKSAVPKLLGTPVALRKTVRNQDLYYAKDAPKRKVIVAIEKGIYPPSCTHTWAIAMDAKTYKVREIHVIEMSCPHAFPTNSSSAYFRSPSSLLLSYSSWALPIIAAK